MSKLEQQIAGWREQMLSAGIQTPVPLEELEIHLREEIGRRVNSGADEQRAFEISVQQMGRPELLNREFNKSERNIMTKRLIASVGIFILLLGVTMILPALGKHKQRNVAALSAGASYVSLTWMDDEKFGLALGTTFALAGATTMLFGFKQRKA